MLSVFTSLRRNVFTRKTLVSMSAVLLVFILFFIAMLSPASAISDNGKIKLSSGSLNVRAGAGTSYDPIGSVSNGTVVTIVGGAPDTSGNQWHKIKYGSTYGYVRYDYVTITSDVEGTLNGSDVSMRTGPGTGYKRITYLDKNDEVTVISEDKSVSPSWYYVLTSDSKFGYVRSDFVDIEEQYTVKTGTVKVSDSLKIRAGAGTSYDIVGYLYNGDKVTITSETTSNGAVWYYITTANGTKGYVHSDYVVIGSTGDNNNENTGGTTGGNTGSDYTPSVNETPNGDYHNVILAETTTNLSVRSGPSTSYDRIEWASSGSTVQILEKTSSSWYYVQSDVGSYGGVRGYVSTDYLKNIRTVKVTHYVEFEEYLDEQGFPESYKNDLRLLHVLYPNWVFKAEHTNMNWDYVIEKESALGKSLSENTRPDSWKSTQEGAYNKETGTWVILDSGGWVQSSEAVIEYYMDPRNFLGSESIFQFLEQSYDGNAQTVSGLENMVSGTFLSKTVTDADGTSLYYPEVIHKAGKTHGVNPYVLASMMIQELGSSGNSASISGTHDVVPGYYNYYNIGAYAHSGNSAITNGLLYASADGNYGRPWDTRYKAIMGGAEYFYKGYIEQGQTTLYLKRFNVQGSYPFTGQFMTNTAGAYQEGIHLSEAYSDSARDVALTFYIPVFKNMPPSPCDMPYLDEIEDNTSTVAANIAINKIANVSSGVELSWTENDDVNGYIIWRKASASNSWTKIETINDPSIKNYIDKTINSGITYSYYVSGYVNQNDKVKFSDSYAKSILYLKQPEPELTNADNGISIKWSDIEGETIYKVYRKLPADTKFTQIGSTTSTSYTDITAKVGETYYYTVQAYKGSAKSSYDPDASIVRLSKVTTKTANSADGVKISWAEKAGAEGYQVWRKTASTKWKLLGSTTELSYVDSTATSGTTYIYATRSYVDIEGTMYKSTYTSSTISYLEQPKFSLSNTDNSISIKWDDINGETLYKVYRKLPTDTKFTQIGKTTSTSFTDKTVKVGQQYFYTVQAYKGTVKSSYDTDTSIVRLSKVTTKTANAADGVKVSWAEKAGAEGYQVWRKTADTKWVLLDSTTELSYIDTTAVSGTTYTYAARSYVDIDGNMYKSTYNSSDILYLAQPSFVLENTDNGINITWYDIEGETLYKVYRKLPSASKFTLIGTTTSTDFIDENVKAGETYYYTVQAYNGSVKSSYIADAFITYEVEESMQLQDNIIPTEQN